MIAPIARISQLHCPRLFFISRAADLPYDNTNIPMTAHLKANYSMRVTSWFGTVSNRHAINGQFVATTA
jgi:hypothetical protein